MKINIQIKHLQHAYEHMQHRNIQIYFCNIQMKYLQYYFRPFETRETYACNMLQTQAKQRMTSSMVIYTISKSSKNWSSLMNWGPTWDPRAIHVGPTWDRANVRWARTHLVEPTLWGAT